MERCSKIIGYVEGLMCTSEDLNDYRVRGSGHHEEIGDRGQGHGQSYVGPGAQ